MDHPNAIFKLLAEKNRLAMFMMLLHDEYCVCDIEKFLSLKQANVSKHLMLFRKLDLIESKKEYQWMHYQLSDEALEKHATLIRYLKQTPYYKQITNGLATFQKHACKPKETKS